MNRIIKTITLTMAMQITLCIATNSVGVKANEIIDNKYEENLQISTDTIKSTNTPGSNEISNDLSLVNTNIELLSASSSENLVATLSKEESYSLESLIGELFFLNSNKNAYSDCKIKDGMPADAYSKFILFYSFFCENGDIFHKIMDTEIKGKGYVVPLDRINEILEQAIGSSIEKNVVIETSFIRERNGDVYTFYGANRGEDQPMIDFVSVTEIQDNKFEIKCNAWNLIDRIEQKEIIKVPITVEVVKGDSDIFNGYTVTKFTMNNANDDSIGNKDKEQTDTFDSSCAGFYILIILAIGILFMKKCIKKKQLNNIH